MGSLWSLPVQHDMVVRASGPFLNAEERQGTLQVHVETASGEITHQGALYEIMLHHLHHLRLDLHHLGHFLPSQMSLLRPLPPLRPILLWWSDHRTKHPKIKK